MAELGQHQDNSEPPADKGRPHWVLATRTPGRISHNDYRRMRWLKNITGKSCPLNHHGNLFKILRIDVIGLCAQLAVAVTDARVCKQLLSQRDSGAQSILDLIQAVWNYSAAFRPFELTSCSDWTSPQISFTRQPTSRHSSHSLVLVGCIQSVWLSMVSKWKRTRWLEEDSVTFIRDVL